jgi:aminoglycoside 6'-N-acetyltransferase I
MLVAVPTVRPIQPDDFDEVVRMRIALWPDGAEDHEPELRRQLAGEHPLGTAYSKNFPISTLVVPRSGGDGLCGFVEVGIRSVAEGCYDGNPVGYVEGWYVDRDVRCRGIGRALVVAAEEWAKAHGCTEMASDSLLGNTVSIDAHKALGFEEVERAVHFRKRLC